MLALQYYIYQKNNSKVKMIKERKLWNQYEDKILKYLKQEKGQAKWSIIAKKMQEEFQISGRTGKQCRQRYHNHLDSSIINTQWTPQEDDLLYKLHEQFGNKWSSISQVIKGRSDNCIKNHFYSKLRKSSRKLNKFIEQFFSKQYQTISTKLISKILQINEQKFQTSTKIDEYIIQCSNALKNKLYKFEDQVDQNMQQQQDFVYIKNLLDEIVSFSKFIKTNKPQKKRKKSLQYNQSFLHPTINLIRSSSFGSQRSDKSQESSIFLSSANCSSFDDADNQDDQCQGSGLRGKSYTTRSSRNLGTSRKSDQTNKAKSVFNQSRNMKIAKSYSHNCSQKNAKKLLNQKTTYQKQQEIFQKQKMKDQTEQKQKINYMQDEMNIFSHKQRYSPASSRNSSSRSQKKKKCFPRNIDEFNEIQEKLSSFHFNMDYKAQQEIIWRVFQPKNKENTEEKQQFGEELDIQMAQSQDID